MRELKRFANKQWLVFDNNVHSHRVYVKAGLPRGYSEYRVSSLTVMKLTFCRGRGAIAPKVLILSSELSL